MILLCLFSICFVMFTLVILECHFGGDLYMFLHCLMFKLFHAVLLSCGKLYCYGYVNVCMQMLAFFFSQRNEPQGRVYWF